jgi:Mg-chelatase subunit ChlD
MIHRQQRLLTLRFALCGLVLLLATETPAAAETTIAVFGSGEVRELSHQRDIQLGESIANVAETVTFANAGHSPAEVVYSFDLPAQAAIFELIIDNAKGSKSRFGVVDAEAATRLVEAPDGDASPDLGLLRMVGLQDDGDNARRRYELRVFPIPGQLSTKVSLRWRTPVELVAGRHSLRIPGRGQDALLSRSKVLLRATMATAELYGGGAELAQSSSKGKRFEFFEPSEGDLVIQAEPKNGKTAAHAEVALYPLSDSTGVAAIRVVLPAATSNVVSRFGRVIVLVDISRSMAEEGREAASQFVDSLLAEMGTGTQVEAIVYDRRSARVLGSLKAGSKDVRSQILQAIRSAPNKNGSDLLGALELARKVLEESASSARKNDTLIAVISDGVLPAKVQAADAAFRLGPDIMADARVLSAVLVPANAPLPDVSDHVMSSLAYQGRGRVAALHYADAADMGRSLLRGLSQPQPLDTMGLVLDKGQWAGADLKGALTPGSSVVALGYYQGGTPKRITVQAKQGGQTVRLAARKQPGKDALAWAHMTLADTSSDSFPASEQAAENRRAFVKAAASLGVVSEVSAIVAIDKDDAFASDRLALAARQGGQHYRRLAPPPEGDSKAHSYRRFEVLARAKSNPFDSEETGKLDRKIISRRMQTHAIPMARGCYDKLLRKDQSAGGEVRIRFELARGEVHSVELAELALSLEPIRDCIIDAVYAMPVPRVRQGSDPELVNLVNYPLRFRLSKPGQGKVVEGPRAKPATGIDSNDPLSGLPE